MNSQFDDQMPPISNYSQSVPQQGTSQPSRRRRKDKHAGTGMTKRKLTEEQVSMLEQSFGSEHKLETGRKDRLALDLGMDPQQVAVWFQNRRAQWRRKKMEEGYHKLRSQHEAAVLEISHLQAQILKLEEQNQEADKEIQRLTERSDGIWNNSPSSSMKVIIEPNPFGEFRMDQGLESVFYVQDSISQANGMEWDNFYYV